MRFIDRYQALFFDMNGTFMFDHDRLGDGEDFHATYERLGGRGLSPVDVNACVRRVCAGIGRDYNDPARYESFPSLLDAVCAYGGLHGLDAQDIADVIATHEVGRVPSWAAETLRALSITHPLALVTNVWAPAEAWAAEFERSGLRDVFRHRVFSSAIGIVKPADRIFREALRGMNVEPAAALFVGDSLERDILPAKWLGFGTVLVGAQADEGVADLSVASIRELLHRCA